MGTSILNWLELFILPPGIIFVFLFIALIISRRAPLPSTFISLTSILMLYIFSMPLTARNLLSSLQIHPVVQLTEYNKGEVDSAIVILGAGRYASAPEYGYRDEISPLTLERLRYGAIIAEKLELPIILSGGKRNAEATSEAVIMNQLMVSVFKINTQYLEINSINTHQQALEVKKLIAHKNIKTIYLVTHAWHMKRAAEEFNLQGFTVKPASMGFSATSKAENDYLPSASALASTSRALHEYYAYWYLQLTQ
ncbi:MAG: hypothetical protein COA74_05260 [Gammaproteobacteria bacterium]|nr:MAG: hypothetical protein COA74_05260 [Gammaproteobacteria bacterium]